GVGGAGAVVVGVGVVGRRDADRVGEGAGGRGVDGGDHRVGHAGAGKQAGDGVAQRAGDVAPAVAAPGEAGHAGGQRVADVHVGGAAGPAVADHDGVGGAAARHHGGDAVGLGDGQIGSLWGPGGAGRVVAQVGIALVREDHGGGVGLGVGADHQGHHL